MTLQQLFFNTLAAQIVKTLAKRLVVENIAVDETLPPVSSTCSADLRHVLRRVSFKKRLQEALEE